MATIQYHGDIIRVGRHQVFGLVRTYRARAHYAAHGAVKGDCRSSASVVVGSRGLDTTASRNILGDMMMQRIAAPVHTEA